MAGSDNFTFRQWRDYRESALTIGRVGPWLLYPGIARIELSLKWKELFLDGAHHGDSEDAETKGRELRDEGREFDGRFDSLLSRSERRLWGPETFPEYLAMIDPADRGRIAEETKRAFLLNETWNWQATFRRNGLVILARAKAVSPGHVIGVDIELGDFESWGFRDLGIGD